MRLWIILLLIIAGIIAAGTYLERSVLRTTDLISHKLDQIQSFVKENHWSKAQTLCEEVDKKWSDQKEAWSPFIHNQELDVVALHLARLLALIENQVQADALAEISVLKVQIVQLHHQEILTLQNIF